MSISIVHDDPVIEQCGYCDNGIQGDQYCRHCGGAGLEAFDLSTLATLSHNLAIAGGLERAWLLGHSRGVFRPLKTDDDVIKEAYERDVWAPGRGRSAP